MNPDGRTDTRAPAPRRLLGTDGRPRARPPNGVDAEVIALGVQAREEGRTAAEIEAALVASGVPQATAEEVADYADLSWAIERSFDVQRRRAWFELGTAMVLLPIGLWMASRAWMPDGPFGLAGYVLALGMILGAMGLKRFVSPKPVGFADRLTR